MENAPAPTYTWRREPEGYALRHRLLGTDLSVLASGGRTVSGYGMGGRARMAGANRRFELFDGDQYVRYAPTLREAKRAAERRAR